MVIAEEKPCPRCGEPHEIIRCPHLKAIEFEDGDGTLIRRLEFLTPADYGPAHRAASDPEPPRDYPRKPSA